MSAITAASIPLQQLLKAAKVIDVVGEYRDVITVRYFASIAEALQKMIVANVTCAVVVDDTSGKCLGILDMLDIVSHALQTHIVVQHVNCEEVEKFHLAGNLFKNEPVASVHNMLKSTAKVSVQNQLYDVIPKLLGSSRAMVADSNGKLVNIISQSDVAQFIAKHNIELKSFMEFTIQQTASLFSFGLKPVVCINGETGTVLDAIQLMYTHKISAVAVVDAMDRLVGNFSSTDIKLLVDSNFRALGQSVNQFLNFGAKQPAACFLTTTLESVVLRMALEKVHRLYIVNDNRCLLGIVSISDILTVFAQQLSLQAP
jgi:CBS domain-containing protein